MKYSYLRRLKDGKEFCIPEQDVAGTLKQGFELVEEAQEEIQVVKVEEPKEQSFQCPLCEFNTKFENALKIHKGRRHK
jgi:hypothetical protein